MANYNNPNYLQQPQLMNGISGQSQLQFPYGSNNMLLSNTPYNNYMGNRPVADLISTYGNEIIYITNKIFSKLENLS